MSTPHIGWAALLLTSPSWAGGAWSPDPIQAEPLAASAAKATPDFSHGSHLDEGLACADCHAPLADRVGWPSRETCLGCHDDPAEISAFFKGERLIAPRFTSLPEGLRFSHRLHAVDARVACDRCHQGIAQSARVDTSLAVSMDSCLGCHTQLDVEASTTEMPYSSCGRCHDKTADRIADRAAMVTARARLRAFDGAPPVIPHPIRQRTPKKCLICHDTGRSVKGKPAGLIPHGADHVNCTQCHVAAEGPLPGGEGLAAELKLAPFEGLPSPGRGTRIWATAAPIVPHATFMRARCVACHGPDGSAPIQAAHPSRASCEQCHVTPAGRFAAP